MYALQGPDGAWATSTRTGARMTYGTYQLATVAARIVGKRDGRRYKVVEA